MKKQIVIFLTVIFTWLFAACATFPKKSGPGLYVNDWPVFCISYPDNWVEKTPDVRETFRAEAPERSPSLRVSVIPNMHTPLKYSSRILIPEIAKIGRDIKVIYDKSSKLNDGTQVQEMEIEWVHNSGIKLNTLFVTAQKEDLWLLVSISDIKGNIREDLKQIAYSLRIKPGKDKIVKVPADIREFLDQYSRDFESHNIEKVMLNYSDQFLHNGSAKTNVKDFVKMVIFGVTSFQINITKFESYENKTYQAGFIMVNNTMKFPFLSTLIKENGQWKFYGNQKQKQL